MPFVRILGDYPEGLYVRTLTERLKQHGFDLEQFRKDMGYGSIVDFLLAVPGLRLSFLNGKVHSDCVVQLSTMPTFSALPLGAGSSLDKPVPSSTSGTKPASYSSMTSQVSTSLSHDSDNSASRSKTQDQKVLGKKPAPPEILALLTALLSSYDCGLKVKKLQQLLLTLNGFDLEKFSIAQGYRDTLEFLEHQKPTLKIRHNKSRLKCIVKKGKGKKCQNPQEKIKTHPDGKSTPPLHNVPPQAPPPKTVEPLNATPDFGGISKPFIAKAGLDASAPLPNGLRASVPVPSTIITKHPSSKELQFSPQPRSDIPAPQSGACRLSGQSAATELSGPTNAQILSKPSLAKPPEHLDELKKQVAHILAQHPEGMSLFQFRAAYSTTYQYHLPLGNAASAKQRLLEMPDIVCMKGYGVQTLLLPVSPEEPSVKPVLLASSGVENAAVVPVDSLPRAVVRPAVVSNPSPLKTPLEPQPQPIHPLASDYLRAADVRENCGQFPTAPKNAAPSQELVRPKSGVGSHLDSSEAGKAVRSRSSSLLEAAVVEPVVIPKSIVKPSLSKKAAVPAPQGCPSIPSTSACLEVPGNEESSFLPESQLSKPPKPVETNIKAVTVPGENVLVPVVRPKPAVIRKPYIPKFLIEPQPTSDHRLRARDVKRNCAVPAEQLTTMLKMEPSVSVEKNIRATAMLGDNVFIPHSPVVFPAEPQASRLNGNWASDGLDIRCTYQANPSFSVEFPGPSPVQPALANIASMTQPVVYRSPIHLPDTLADPSFSSASHQSVSRIQLRKWESVSSRLAEPDPQGGPAWPPSPSHIVEQPDCTFTADRPDLFQRVSQPQGQGHGPVPVFAADGNPTSPPSLTLPGLQPLQSPSARQQEKVYHMQPCSSVPAAEESKIAAPSAGVHSKPVAHPMHDVSGSSLARSSITPSPSASHKPAPSSFKIWTEAATLPSEPLISLPQLHCTHENSTVTSSVQPSALSLAPPGSPTSETNQPSCVSFTAGSGYDASSQSKSSLATSREGSDQQNCHSTLPDNQMYLLEGQLTQPLQNSPPSRSSNNCIIL